MPIVPVSELTSGGGVALGDTLPAVRSAASRRVRTNFVRVTNIAAMTALTGLSDNDTIEVLGHSAEGDGGGGSFYWDASSTATVDGGTVLASDAGGTGRWVRAYSGDVNVLWFGAPSGTAIQAALNTGKNVYVPAGSYSCPSALTLSSDQSIRGDGDSTVLTFPEDVSGITASTVNDVSISDLVIVGTDSPDNPTRGVFFSAVTRGLVERVRVEGFSLSGIQASNGSAYITTRDCYIGTMLSPRNTSSDIGYYSGCNYSVAEGNTCLGGSWLGINLQLGAKGCRVANNYIANSMGYGINVYDLDASEDIDCTITGNVIQDIQGTAVTTNQPLGAGIYVVNCGGVSITGNTVRNTNVSTDTESLAPAGIGINGAQGAIAVTGNVVEDCNWYGIMAVSSTAGMINISSNVIRKCARHGIFIKASNNVNISGNIINNGNAGSVPGIVWDYVSGGDNGLGCISGNYIRGGNTTGVTIGIRMIRINQVSITGNMIHDPQLQGIQLDTCDEIPVSGNLIYSANDSGIEMIACNRCVVSGGVIQTGATNSIEASGSGSGNLAESVSLSPNVVSNGASAGLMIVTRGSAAPTTGTWAVGDRVYNTAPAASGTMGWVCTTAGTPGTWDTFASISA